MDGRTHASVGVATGLLLSCTVPIASSYEQLAIGIGASIVGSLFADLDIEQSLGGKSLRKFLSFAVPIVSILFLGKVLGFIDFSKSGIKTEQILAMLLFVGIGIYARSRPHREFTHSIFILYCTTACVYCFMWSYVWPWYLAGYLSHLVIDILNTKGESILWSLPPKFSLRLCKADGITNKVLFFAGIIASIAVIAFKGGVWFG